LRWPASGEGTETDAPARSRPPDDVIDPAVGVEPSDTVGPVEGEDVEVTALAINVSVPEGLRWTDARRGETFLLTTLNVRLLPDGHLAARAYGRPTAGGRGAYVGFRVPDTPELAALVAEAADRAARLWGAHRGLS
jgi:hypothetical protein